MVLGFTYCPSNKMRKSRDLLIAFKKEKTKKKTKKRKKKMPHKSVVFTFKQDFGFTNDLPTGLLL